MSTAAQVAANQDNAQLSTGPVTAEGKAKVSKNALKTGLTGHAVLLPTDDAELYAKHVESFRVRYSPVGEAETELVQSIADTAWRLARIPSLEASLYALGRTRFVDLHKDEQDPQIRASLIQAEILIAFERQFRNLGTQESRLRRQREKDEIALTDLQKKRANERSTRLQAATYKCIAAADNNQLDEFDLGQFGFEFSFDELTQFAIKRRPNLAAVFERATARRQHKKHAA